MRKKGQDWFKYAEESATIIKSFTGYEVSWKCNKGHINFQTIIDDRIQNDICLKCGDYYKYKVID
jgi:hypothetical protein